MIPKPQTAQSQPKILIAAGFMTKLIYSAAISSARAAAVIGRAATLRSQALRRVLRTVFS